MPVRSEDNAARMVASSARHARDWNRQHREEIYSQRGLREAFAFNIRNRYTDQALYGRFLGAAFGIDRRLFKARVQCKMDINIALNRITREFYRRHVCSTTNSKLNKTKIAEVMFDVSRNTGAQDILKLGHRQCSIAAGATPDFSGGPLHSRACARSCELWKCNSGAATYCEGSRAVEIKSPLLVSIEGYSKQEYSAKWISILRSIESRENFTDGMFALRLILSWINEKLRR